MTPEQFAALAEALATIDRRLANIERDSADSAAALEAQAEATAKLSELYVSLDAKQDDLATTLGNYVEATRSLRNDSRNLHSLVREKLKVVPGG